MLKTKTIRVRQQARKIQMQRRKTKKKKFTSARSATWSIPSTKASEDTFLNPIRISRKFISRSKQLGSSTKIDEIFSASPRNYFTFRWIRTRLCPKPRLRDNTTACETHSKRLICTWAGTLGIPRSPGAYF